MSLNNKKKTPTTSDVFDDDFEVIYEGDLPDISIDDDDDDDYRDVLSGLSDIDHTDYIRKNDYDRLTKKLKDKNRKNSRKSRNQKGKDNFFDTSYYDEDFLDELDDELYDDDNAMDDDYDDSRNGRKKEKNRRKKRGVKIPNVAKPVAKTAKTGGKILFKFINFLLRMGTLLLIAWIIYLLGLHFLTNVGPFGNIISRLTAADQDVTAKDGVLENEKLIVKFGENGEIVSIFDKEAQKETLEEAANKFKLYDDTDGDAWDIRIYYMEKNPKTMQLISSKFYVDGPNAAAEQTFEFGKSVLTQKVILQKNSDYVTFDTTVDWKETEKMLRTDFATCIHTDEVTCNIQYGSLKRPTHRNTSWEMTKFEVCAHKWIDLSRDDYGVALLNDCKYGYAVLENRMDINLLRSTMSPGVDADKAVHTFRYAYYPHRGNEKHALVEQKAIAFNILPVLTNGHNAAALPESFLQTDCTNVEITAVKKAEDSDRLVVRMYQTDGTESICCVTLPARVKKVSFCDLMEREAEEVPVENGAVVLKFKPFEIHTILVEM